MTSLATPKSRPAQRPTPRPGIMDIAPYVPGRAKAGGSVEIRKLSSNEAALGPSPKAVEAFRAAALDLHRYPDGDSLALRETIARRYGLALDRLIIGAGSDELLHLLVAAYAGPGDEVLMSRHGFLVYEIAARSVGATIVKAPETNLTADVDALLAAVTERTRIVFLANPNNPTGTYLSSAEVRRLHAGLPADTLLVIDAAYAEFVRRNDYDSGIDLVARFDNVVMSRTFSKVYGLAALRVGWAYGPTHVIDALNRIRGPFNVSTAGQAAAAAAMEDQAHIDAAVAHNERALAWLTAEVTALGLAVTPSVGNFLLVHFGATPGRTPREIEARLAERGVLVRAVAAYDLPDHLRISVGRDAENQAFIDALREILHG